MPAAERRRRQLDYQQGKKRGSVRLSGQATSMLPWPQAKRLMHGWGVGVCVCVCVCAALDAQMAEKAVRTQHEVTDESVPQSQGGRA
jgi:hypothetical protein